METLKTIKLQKPDKTAGIPLMEAFAKRHSERNFEQKALSPKHLSEVMWAAYGVNRDDGKRTVPSAFAICPLDIYAVLEDGIYVYSPKTHCLVMLKEGDFRKQAGSQSYVQTAPLNLLYFADFGKYKNTGNEMIDRLMADDTVKTRFTLLDAGHCSQNVYLYCSSEGLKAVTRGAADEVFFKKLLGLNEEHHFIVAQSIGY